MASSKSTALGQNKQMLRVKTFVLNHFERILVIVILAVVAAAHFWFARGIPILFFYFLPALVAGYVLGKRNALMTAIFSILAVAFAFVATPETFNVKWGGDSDLLLATDLAAWAGFLILAALVTGQLYEDKERRIQELRSAYLGILQVLARYLDSPEGPTKGHCLRVANLSAEIARAMGLPNSTVDNVHAAALLHDIETTDGMSGDVIHRAAMLSEEDETMMESAGKTGAILSSVGTVLKEAIPLIRYHSLHAEGKEPQDAPTELDAPPVGARIVGVADAYDLLVTDKPYATGRAPWVAVKEIEKGIGTRYDREVVEGLKSVVARRLEQDKRVAALAGAATAN